MATKKDLRQCLHRQFIRLLLAHPHECMELVFKLIYQVQFYVVNYAFFLLCSARGKMSKKCKGCSAWEAAVCAKAPLPEGLAQQRAGLWTCCLLLCGSFCNVGNPVKEELWSGESSVVQRSRECFLLCQFVSTHPCLLLSPVRWKRWWICVDPRMMLPFLQGNCCSSSTSAPCCWSVAEPGFAITAITLFQLNLLFFFFFNTLF